MCYYCGYIDAPFVASLKYHQKKNPWKEKKVRKEMCFRPRFWTARLYWDRDNLNYIKYQVHSTIPCLIFFTGPSDQEPQPLSSASTSSISSQSRKAVPANKENVHMEFRPMTQISEGGESSRPATKEDIKTTSSPYSSRKVGKASWDYNALGILLGNCLLEIRC